MGLKKMSEKDIPLMKNYAPKIRNVRTNAAAYTIRATPHAHPIFLQNIPQALFLLKSLGDNEKSSDTE